MAYIQTAVGDSVVYLGVKVYVVDHKGNKEVHLTVHDGEESYPTTSFVIPSSAL